MKKFLIGCALALLICTNVFADVELGISLEPALSQKMYSDKYDVTLWGDGFSAGFLLYVTPFFVTVPIAKDYTFDIGVNAQIGGTGRKAMAGNNSDVKFPYIEDSWISLTLAAGPAIRFNINQNNSIFATLGLKVLDGDFFFNCDMGYRLWFVNKQKFHLGLMTGLNFASGEEAVYWKVTIKNGRVTVTDSGTTNLKSSMLNFYIGLNFAIGKRGYDKIANK